MLIDSDDISIHVESCSLTQMTSLFMLNHGFYSKYMFCVTNAMMLLFVLYIKDPFVLIVFCVLFYERVITSTVCLNISLNLPFCFHLLCFVRLQTMFK